MTRYRKVDVRLWGDQKFRALSKPNPNAQHLWLYLLTGPHTTLLPGLFQIGVGSIAEKLRWPYVETEKCVQEIVDLGMIHYDADALVIWIPNYILYNFPQNQNVLKGWRDAWDEVPDSPLKLRFLINAKSIIDQYFEKISSSLIEFFPEIISSNILGLPIPHAIPQPVGLPIPHAIPHGEPHPLGYTKPGTGAGTGIKKKITKKKFIKKNSRQKFSKQVPGESLLEASWPIDSTLLDMTSMPAPTTEKVKVPDGVR